MRLIAYSLGAAEEVTGSCHMLELNNGLLQIDMGLFQGKRKESDQKNREFNIDIIQMSEECVNALKDIDVT